MKKSIILVLIIITIAAFFGIEYICGIKYSSGPVISITSDIQNLPDGIGMIKGKEHILSDRTDIYCDNITDRTIVECKSRNSPLFLYSDDDFVVFLVSTWHKYNGLACNHPIAAHLTDTCYLYDRASGNITELANTSGYRFIVYCDKNYYCIYEYDKNCVLTVNIQKNETAKKYDIPDCSNCGIIEFLSQDNAFILNADYSENYIVFE